MIVEIEKPHGDMYAPLRYNEGKMETAKAENIAGSDGSHVVATRNLPEGTTLEDEFERLRTKANKAASRRPPKNFSFHMSVNPAGTDKVLSDAEAAELIDKIMETLGYKDQPYRIYKHTDIAREHYHVVSVRSGQDGRMISDSFERLVLRKKLRELTNEYGFEIVLNNREKAIEKKQEAADSVAEEKKAPAAEGKKPVRKEKEQPVEKKRQYVPPFSRDSSEPVTEQLRKAHEDVIGQWSFTSFEQYAALMLRRYGFLVERQNDEGNVSVRGLYNNLGKSTPLLENIDITRRIRDDIQDTISRSDMKKKREQKERIMKLSEAAAKACTTFEQYRALMERKGVYVVVSWTKDGDPFGVSYIDKATKCAWKGSEISRDMKWLIATAAGKGWEIKKDKYERLSNRMMKMPSRVQIFKTETNEEVNKQHPISIGGEQVDGKNFTRIVGGQSRRAVLKNDKKEHFKKDGPLGDDVDRDEIDRDEVGRNM